MYGGRFTKQCLRNNTYKRVREAELGNGAVEFKNDIVGI